ncbi:MAG: methyltransferase [Candidatus Sericytochromatia bacterium]|nr:methyltransferase [Candidatus Sericytochromatia bacterium]
MPRREDLPVLVVWGLVLVLAVRAWTAAPGLAPTLLVLFQGLVLRQLLGRAPAVSRGGVRATLFAFLGTATPLLFRPAPVPWPEPWAPAVAVLAGLVQVSGLLLMLAAVVALGRSFGVRPALRRLVTIGPYARMRHPLYVGEWLCAAGLCLAHPSAWNLLVLLCTGCLLALRAWLEERVLAADSAWSGYARRVPAWPRRLRQPPVA